MNKNYFEEIDGIIRKNLDKRGMDKVNFTGELKRATNELFKSTSILIVTGFVIKDCLSGETDGPLGAVSLAGALEQLGKNVVLVTDKYSEKLIRCCCRVKRIKAPVEVITHENVQELSSKLLQKYKPSHIVGIERPGRAKDGRCYSMRGEDLSALVPNTDILFEKAREMGVTTVCVGDGGNEVGMGKASMQIANMVDKGELICASFTSDYLITAGVSNWGGHAITAGLSIMADIMLLHDTFTEMELLKELIKAGAVDGCTKKRECTVDGLSLKDNLEILEKLKSVVETALREEFGAKIAI